MPITALPPAPLETDEPEDFEVKAIAHAAAQHVMTEEINDALEVMNTMEASALGSAVTATNAAATALGAANFKGNWAAGTYVRPACVKHGGRFWLVATVSTTGTPGVSSDWIPLDAGIVPTSVVSANTAGVVGVRYLIAATGITLTAPTVWLKGDYFGFREVAGLLGAMVDFGATKVRSKTVGIATFDVPCQGMDLFYEDATRGLI